MKGYGEMTFQDAINIMAGKQEGDYYEASLLVAQDLTTKGDSPLGDVDGVAQWVFNGDYDGTETLDTIQAELDETEES